MSSRNVYLRADERAAAAALYRTLQECATRLAKGDAPASVLANGEAQIEKAGFTLDYLALRDAATLAPPQTNAKSALRLLVAARIGATRLIDNVHAQIAQES